MIRRPPISPLFPSPPLSQPPRNPPQQAASQQPAYPALRGERAVDEPVLVSLPQILWSVVPGVGRHLADRPFVQLRTDDHALAEERVLVVVPRDDGATRAQDRS